MEQQRQLAAAAEQATQAYIAHLEAELVREKNILAELMAAIEKAADDPDVTTSAEKGRAEVPSSDESSIESIEDDEMEVHSAP